MGLKIDLNIIHKIMLSKKQINHYFKPTYASFRENSNYIHYRCFVNRKPSEIELKIFQEYYKVTILKCRYNKSKKELYLMISNVIEDAEFINNYYDVNEEKEEIENKVIENKLGYCEMLSIILIFLAIGFAIYIKSEKDLKN